MPPRLRVLGLLILLLAVTARAEDFVGPPDPALVDALHELTDAMHCAGKMFRTDARIMAILKLRTHHSRRPLLERAMALDQHYRRWSETHCGPRPETAQR